MSEATPRSQMLISYVPGEECRVAIVEAGQLEEFHAERASSISRVGNIYVGRVANVEPAIQAAFVDFGVEHHGFLHVTDLHPRYFPGEDDETTERVGKKTPRRDRPPIQRCLRRGDEVTVQVLKEGVGTKGPTLTSYLSIPGRFLVMMPQMDRVGVSRKVEDEELRHKMREILDQLELPDGFGFILRTAGMDRTKLELKRDLAYLMRLWKDMEARLGAGNKPRLLYSESDLLVRALRDMLGPEIGEVVIDNEHALARASGFLKIVAPRSRVRLLQHPGPTPLFHAFGVEQQIAMIHAREVPLPSGGRLVIDETEALVAIDVNSGKMRDARDAETNAYRTNVEAVDAICRQLRLRDLGGIVINDLIDMRQSAHRKDIEQRFRERLKRDRARTTTLAISEFGILEMTRQRMRGSHESVHFADCPTCRGRGLVQRPDSVAADSMRNLAALLAYENVAKVEMVVSPRVASELLSSRRQALGRLERASGKHIDVRVSETVAVDRVTFYAYDGAGADIDVERLPQAKAPTDLKVWESGAEDGAWAVDAKEEQATPEAEVIEEVVPAHAPHPIEIEGGDEVDISAASPDALTPGRPGRRRRRRGGRGRSGQPGAPSQGEVRAQPAPPAEGSADHAGAPIMEAQPLPEGGAGPVDGQAPGEGGRRRRRRRRRRRGGRGPDGQGAPALDGQGVPVHDGQAAPVQDGPDVQPDEIPPPPSEGLRGDSWDLEPSAVPPMRSPAPARPAAGPARPAAGPARPAVQSPVPRDGQQPAQEGQGGRRRRRRRGGRGRGGQGGEGGAPGGPPAGPAGGSGARPAGPPNGTPAPGGPKPRFLYSTRRRLGPGERPTGADRE